MDGTFCGKSDHRELLDQFFTDLGCAPGRMILLNGENSLFNLKGQFVGISVGGSTSILEPLNADIFVSIKDLVAGFAGIPNSRQTAAIFSPSRSFANNRRRSSI